VVVSFGSLFLSGIPFSGGVSLTGMNNFKDALRVGSLDISHGEPGKLTIQTTARVFNPSVVAAALGSLSFDLVVNDTIHVGTVEIANFTLVAQANHHGITTKRPLHELTP